MELIHAIILSIVEGLTEFLPVSSTGHLILTSKLLQIAQTPFVKTFEIVIQLGAILAVLVLYRQRLTKDLNIWLKIFAAFIPTGILGLILYKFVKMYLLGNFWVTVVALAVGGLVMIILELIINKNRNLSLEKLPLKKVLLLGIFQSLAFVPGVSRSAATIIGGRILGLSREAAVETSFFLAVPTMFAATTLDILESNLSFNRQELLVIAIGLVGSFVTAIVAIKFLIKFVQNHTLIPFAIYRIIIAIAFVVFGVF